MHSRLIDLARRGVAWREPANDNLSCARGIVFALIAAVPVWCLLGMLAAIAMRWM